MLSESELNKHFLREQPKNLYMIFGEEKVTVRAAVQKLLKKIAPEGLSEFNYHAFDGDVSMSELSVCADILPFMAERNIIVVNDLNIDKLAADDSEALMTIVDNLPDTTVLLLAMPSLELSSSSAGAKFKKLLKTVEKKGIAAEMTRHTGRILEQDLVKWAKKGGSPMTELTAHYLIRTAGEDLSVLNNEVKKLTAYADGEEITREMIDLLVSKNLEASIYDLFGYIVSGDSDRSMRNLSTLFYMRYEPMAICTNLAYAYIDAYRARVASEAAVKAEDAAVAFGYGKAAWRLTKKLRQIRTVSTAALRRSIDAVQACQLTLMSSASDPATEIEKLVCTLLMIAEDTADD